MMPYGRGKEHSMTRGTRVALPFLHTWRIHKLLSISELAEAANVSRPTIIQLENGKHEANLTTVGKLAAGLGITRRQLVYEQPEEVSEQQ